MWEKRVREGTLLRLYTGDNGGLSMVSPQCPRRGHGPKLPGLEKVLPAAHVGHPFGVSLGMGLCEKPREPESRWGAGNNQGL